MVGARRAATHQAPRRKTSLGFLVGPQGGATHPLLRILDSHAANVVQNHFDKSGSPFSLREKADEGNQIKHMHRLFDYFDPLTPTLPLCMDLGHR
jgi:hypothetical protein